VPVRHPEWHVRIDEVPVNERHVDVADLRRLYVDEGLSEVEIAEQLGWRTRYGRPPADPAMQRCVGAC